MKDPDEEQKDSWEVMQNHLSRDPESQEPELEEAGLDPDVLSEVDSEEEVIHALYKALREAREPLVEMMKGKRELDPDEFKQRSALVRELEYRITVHPILYRLRNASKRLSIEYGLKKLAKQSTELTNSIRETERELGFLKKSLEECEKSRALLSRENLEKDWPIKGLDFVTPLAFYLINASQEDFDTAMSELMPEKREQLQVFVEVVKVIKRLEIE